MVDQANNKPGYVNLSLKYLKLETNIIQLNKKSRTLRAPKLYKFFGCHDIQHNNT
jgi:hypothetical protein